MAEPLVRAWNLQRSFGSGQSAVVAVAQASLVIEPHDRIALIGSSGSGKSTLLHLIAGLDEPTDGTIEWPALGPIQALRPGPLSIAFQGPSLLAQLTVIENVALPLLLTGVSQEHALDAADALLERFELDPVAHELPEELSGGQIQRAGLARALVGSPKLVLADEPTGQQDRAGRDRVMDALLATVSELGAALVVATHDPAVAERLATRWSMRNGRLTLEQTTCTC
jgi:ABC-type lipoprotein export system ATPase subunit